MRGLLRTSCQPLALLPRAATSVDTTPTTSPITLTDVLAPTPDELTLTATGFGGPVSLATSASPTDLGNNVYRFYLNGKLNVGAVTLAIAADAIADSTGAQNRALTQRFTVTGTIGSITGPQDGGAIGLASQNSRGFLDVTFGFLEGQTPDLASIYDLEPEFAINPATGGASYSIALDATQAPVLVAHVDGSTTWTFR